MNRPGNRADAKQSPFCVTGATTAVKTKTGTTAKLSSVKDKIASKRLPHATIPYFPVLRFTELKITIAAALISAFLLARRLWVGPRLFPLSPVSGLLSVIPSTVDKIWFAALVVLLAAITIAPRLRAFAVIFLALAGSLSLWDQNRWQPWFFQYFFMLGAMAFSAKKNADDHHALNACRVIVASTYFWSGLQKLNASFVRETWPDVSGPLLGHLPVIFSRIPYFVVLGIPILEMATGVGLITQRWRRASAILAISTHVFVVTLLVASVENIVVWPWNVAMISFVLFLFWRDKVTVPRSIIVPRGALHAFVLLLFGVMPALSFFGFWDSYLSSALYSGNTDQAVVLVSPEVIERLPAAIHPHIWQSSKPFFLDINRWAYADLNVPVYPEPRVYRAVTEQICRYADNSPDVKLLIRGRPNPFTGHRKSEYYDCDHLDEVR